MGEARRRLPPGKQDLGPQTELVAEPDQVLVQHLDLVQLDLAHAVTWSTEARLWPVPLLASLASAASSPIQVQPHIDVQVVRREVILPIFFTVESFFLALMFDQEQRQQAISRVGPGPEITGSGL